MDRVIKFRAWNPQGDMLQPFEVGDGTTNEKLLFEEKWPIMQFTGLTDKNGKEIYEGDIVLSNVGYGAFKTEVKTAKVFKGGWYPFCVGGDPTSSEIIGNIYENPELLTN